jgi:branched-chain amino acid aminotransferase
MDFVNINGKTIEADKALIKKDDHSYRYGHGLFETMKIVSETILLSDLHFERLFKSLAILKLNAPKFFSPQTLTQQILEICKKNNCERLARVRLSISGGNGGLYDYSEKIQYLIECWPLPESINLLNENGLVIDVFPYAKKSNDTFSSLKSASHLPYVMAAKFVKENRLNDALLLNIHNRICDSTIANVFWIKEDRIFTPPISEGCIDGVMRRHLFETLKNSNYQPSGKSCEIHDLENADEVFLTNAIQGIRWVKEFRNKIYNNSVSSEIHSLLFDQ